MHFRLRKRRNSKGNLGENKKKASVAVNEHFPRLKEKKPENFARMFQIRKANMFFFSFSVGVLRFISNEISLLLF